MGSLGNEFDDVMRGAAAAEERQQAGTQAELFPAGEPTDAEIEQSAIAAVERMKARKANGGSLRAGGKSGQTAGDGTGGSPQPSQVAPGPPQPAPGANGSGDGQTGAGKRGPVKPPPRPAGAPDVRAPLPPLRGAERSGSQESEQGPLSQAEAQAIVDDQFKRLREYVGETLATEYTRLHGKPKSGLGRALAIAALVAAFLTGWLGSAATGHQSIAARGASTSALSVFIARNPTGSLRDILTCSARAGLVRKTTRHGVVCSGSGGAEGWLLP